MLNKKYLKLLLIALSLFIGIELILRIAFGFCDTVLMEESKNYEYIAQPNQIRDRFGSHIIYNTLSMRNAKLDPSSVKILCFGDSVINGGVLTDHESLATTILSNQISNLYGINAQFLNISAGSWGPDNCFAYLKERGDFGAKLMLLFVNSHDAYDTMNFDKVVDVHPSYPSHQYAVAINELWERYLYPRLENLIKKDAEHTSEELVISKKKDGQPINSGFKNFIAFSKLHNIPLIVYLHAEKSELNEGVYNEEGQQIIKLLEEANIQLVTDLHSGLEVGDFRDAIHLNEKGQKNIASNIFHAIKTKQFDFLGQ